MKTKINDANVELDIYTILVELENKDDLNDLIGILEKELDKQLGKVYLVVQVKNLVCMTKNSKPM